MSGDGGGRAHGDARQAIVGDAFVDLVDTLVSGFDVIDVLTGLTGRCVDLLGASAAAILLADSDGCLTVLGASSDDVRLLELFELQNEQGPGLDCYKSGKIVADANLSASLCMATICHTLPGGRVSFGVRRSDAPRAFDTRMFEPVHVGADPAV